MAPVAMREYVDDAQEMRIGDADVRDGMTHVSFDGFSRMRDA